MKIIYDKLVQATRRQNLRTGSTGVRITDKTLLSNFKATQVILSKDNHLRVFFLEIYKHFLYFIQLVSSILYNTDFDILTMCRFLILSNGCSVLGLPVCCMYAEVPYFKQASVDGHLSFSELLAIIYQVFSYESMEYLRMDVLNHTHSKLEQTLLN